MCGVLEGKKTFNKVLPSWLQISFQIYPESFLTKWIQGWYPHIHADRRNLSLHGLLSSGLREIVSRAVQPESGGSPCSPYESGEGVLPWIPNDNYIEWQMDNYTSTG